MPKLHQADNWFQIARRDEDGELLTVSILGPTMEDIGSQTSQDIQDAKSALYAGSDLLRHARYDHELTQPGLHLLTEANLNAWRATNLGVVSIYFENNSELGIPVPSEDEYPEGWAQLNRRNKRFYLSHISKDWRITRARKHDFIDGYLEGMGYNIRVLPFNANKDPQGMGAADYVLLSWLEDDDAKASEIRIDGISRAQTRNQIRKPARQYIRRHGSAPVESENGSNGNGEPIMVVKAGSKQRFDISKLPAQTVTVINNRKQPVSITWDGSWSAVSAFKEIARMGYPVRVSKK